MFSLTKLLQSKAIPNLNVATDAQHFLELAGHPLRRMDMDVMSTPWEFQSSTPKAHPFDQVAICSVANFAGVHLVGSPGSTAAMGDDADMAATQDLKQWSTQNKGVYG